MSDTTFIDHQTPIVTPWLQDVNDTVYKALGAPKTIAQAIANLGVTTKASNLSDLASIPQALSNLGISSTADRSHGSSLIGYLPSGAGATGRTVQDKLGELLSVRDFGAKGDGTTDDSAAIRLALDNVPLSGGGIYFPPGTYYVGSVIYIPQRVNSGVGYGIRITGDNAVLKGTGAGTGEIFESGTGTSSTNGSTNWNQTPESSTSLHYNTVIEGIIFRDTGLAVKVFNWCQNCAIRDCMFENVRAAIYSSRSFYMNVINCQAQFDTGATNTDILYHFDDFVNVMTLLSVKAEGNSKTGIGFQISNGADGQGIVDCSSESLNTGFNITGQLQGFSIEYCYIEGNTTGINLDNNTHNAVFIDKNWFNGNTTDIYSANAWNGTIGRNNDSLSVVNIQGSSNTGRVILPVREYPDTGTNNHTTRTAIPTNWTIPKNTVVEVDDRIYLSSSGYTAPVAAIESSLLGGTIIPYKFVGNINDNHYGLIPYCTITNNTNPGPGTLVIDTQLTYDNTNSGVFFDFTVTDTNSTYYISGRVQCGTHVYRDDGYSQTVTATNNGGVLRLTIGNFTNASITGKVRAV